MIPVIGASTVGVVLFVVAFIVGLALFVGAGYLAVVFLGWVYWEVRGKLVARRFYREWQKADREYKRDTRALVRDWHHES